MRGGPNIYSIIEDGQQFEALVDEKGAHGFDVLVGGRIFHLEAIDERSKLLAGSAAIVVSGPQTVLAEMPGKVVKLSVAAGAETECRPRSSASVSRNSAPLATNHSIKRVWPPKSASLGDSLLQSQARPKTGNGI